MLEFFRRLFYPEPRSSDTAKERLRLVLLSDHLSLAPDVVEALKRDLLAVISRYLEIDPALADVTFEQREQEVAMLASIPIMGVRARSEREAEAAGGPPAQSLAPEASLEALPHVAERPESQPEDEAIMEPGAPAEPHAPVMKTSAPEDALRPSTAGSSARRRRRKKAAALANRTSQTQAAPGFGPA